MKRLLSALLLAALLLPSCRPLSDDPSGTTSPTDTDPVTQGQSASPITTSPADPEPITHYELTLTEVMPDNKHLIMGHDRDWVEIYSREDETVSLDGYFLTDDPEKPYEMSLTGMSIDPGQYLVIELGEDAPFRLSSLGESVYLTHKGQTVSVVTFPEPQDGESYSASGRCLYPTPGFRDDAEGYLAYLDSRPLPPLAITEVISSNRTHLPQSGQCFDLVEITNLSSGPISLAGYTLTDKRKEPSRYDFPDITLAAGQSYVVFCSGALSLGENHASFKISSTGESVWLYKEGVLVDVLVVPGDVKSDESFGLDGKRPSYFSDPTPGEKNGSGYMVLIERPVASAPSGVYAEPVQVSLSGQGEIYYTLDGSRPTTASERYDGPITVQGVTTLRAICFADGRESSPASFTYAVGVEHELPILTVSIPQDSLTGSQGVLNHIKESYEHEAVLTLIEGGEEKFSLPFGFRLHGNDSRKGDKQNFQLRFRSEYGASKLNYPVFANREFTEYNSLLLKGGSEDFPTAMLRDELATSLVDGTTALYAQAMKPVVLYLGGEYWGVYYLRERYSDDYVASHLNVSAESVDLLYSYGGVQSGEDDDYRALLSYVASHDMSTREGFDYLTQKVDILSLMDWYICRSYMGDKDLANIRYFRSEEGDGKWRWCYFDLDWSFWIDDDRPLTSIVKGADRHGLILAAFKSEEGRDLFLRRYAELMGTVLNEQTIISRIDAIADLIRSEMPRDRERWDYSMTRWENALENLRAYVRDGVRDRRVLDDLKSYFSLSDDEMTHYFGEKA